MRFSVVMAAWRLRAEPLKTEATVLNVSNRYLNQILNLQSIALFKIWLVFFGEQIHRTSSKEFCAAVKLKRKHLLYVDTQLNYAHYLSFKYIDSTSITTSFIEYCTSKCTQRISFSEEFQNELYKLILNGDRFFFENKYTN